MAPQKSKAAAAKAKKKAKAARYKAYHRMRQNEAAKLEKVTLGRLVNLMCSAYNTRFDHRRIRKPAVYHERHDESLKFTLKAGDDEGRPPYPWERNPWQRNAWEWNAKLEQPPSLSDLGINLGIEGTSLSPIDAMGHLGKLPTEIRDKILRYLLVSTRDIKVFNGWSIVYPRSKPNLDVSILSTCKVLHLQGVRIMFGENTFLYDIRDIIQGTLSPTSMSVVYGGCLVPIDVYGHLIRHIKIHIDPNRLLIKNADTFTKAIQKFLPNHGLVEPANIHTLTLEIPAKIKQQPGTMNVWDLFGSDVRDTLAKLNIQFIRIIATKLEDNWEEKYEYAIDLRHFHKLKQEQEQKDKMKKTLDRECPAVKKRIHAIIDTSRVRVYNIPVRIWELTVLGPVQANEKKVYWKHLEKEAPPRGVYKLNAGQTWCLSQIWDPRDRLANLTPQLPSDERTTAWLEGIHEGSNPWRA
ncbi:hypothetical protein Hte_006115 [Hypoxylon texense]